AYLHVPLSLYYADQMQAPVLAGFFMLALLFVPALVIARCEEIFRRRTLAPWAAKACVGVALVLILVIAVRRVPIEPDSNSSSYPPAAPASVQILQKELALAPGAPFRGRALTLVAQDFQTGTDPDISPLFLAVLGVLEDHYGRYTGNDHWNDLLYFNIP